MANIFLAVLLVMTLSHDGPNLGLWSKKWIYRRSTATLLMSRDRFEQIRADLHTQSDDESSSGLKKIGILLQMLNENSGFRVWGLGFRP